MQDVVVPIARNPESLTRKRAFSYGISFRRGVLAAVDLDNQSGLEAGKVQNAALERHLTTKFEANFKEGN